MPRYVVVNLNEMATIGYFGYKTDSREFKVFVASESNLKPSFHIMSGKMGNDDYKCVAVLLKTFTVIEFPDTPSENRTRFPKKVFKLFREFLDKKNIIYPEDSNWKTLLKDWNKEHQSNPEVWVKEDMPTPDVDDFKYADKFGL